MQDYVNVWLCAKGFDALPEIKHLEGHIQIWSRRTYSNIDEFHNFILVWQSTTLTVKPIQKKDTCSRFSLARANDVPLQGVFKTTHNSTKVSSLLFEVLLEGGCNDTTSKWNHVGPGIWHCLSSTTANVTFCGLDLVTWYIQP